MSSNIQKEVWTKLDFKVFYQYHVCSLFKKKLNKPNRTIQRYGCMCNVHECNIQQWLHRHTFESGARVTFTAVIELNTKSSHVYRFCMKHSYWEFKYTIIQPLDTNTIACEMYRIVSNKRLYICMCTILCGLCM